MECKAEPMRRGAGAKGRAQNFLGSQKIFAYIV